MCSVLAQENTKPVAKLRNAARSINDILINALLIKL